VEEADNWVASLRADHRAAEERHAGEAKALSAKLAAAAAEKLALQRGFEARLATMKGELSTAQVSAKSPCQMTPLVTLLRALHPGDEGQKLGSC
jgi:hypothetical protein